MDVSAKKLPFRVKVQRGTNLAMTTAFAWIIDTLACACSILHAVLSVEIVLPN